MEHGGFFDFQLGLLKQGFSKTQNFIHDFCFFGHSKGKELMDMVLTLKKYHRRRLWLRKLWRGERSGLNRQLQNDDMWPV
ncbi:hypothetical protein [Paenibacillus sp. Marseille-P2973]|uniref:hypothetical protein n=1 Tax=Paenibacillus sp. Marseille-P2973 TaxID=1871032 RepID=UPI001B3771BC|nr:hypothetical protein [Paenibacillus sp. Marseille-P2973]